MYGHVWVVLGLLATHPSWGIVALPLLARLYVRAKDLAGVPAKHRPAYRSAAPAVAGRRLRLGAGDDRDPLSDWVIDPAFPVVVCVARGVRATAENTAEAEVVGRGVARLRGRLLTRDGEPYGEDAEFWSEGVFVVIPHHAQITAVRRELVRHRPWSGDPFVDTVDKMQGQECDAVVVTYGVADPEYALAERKFIYSRGYAVSLPAGRVYPLGAHRRVMLLIDNAPWHAGEPVRAALADDPHLELKRPPAYSPQLNPIERFWRVLRRRATHIRLFDTAADLRRSLRNNLCYFQTVRDRVRSLLAGRKPK